MIDRLLHIQITGLVEGGAKAWDTASENDTHYARLGWGIVP